jgi:UDP-N-acetylglucosamine acyltransferase
MASVDPTAILEGDVTLGDGVTVGPFSYLKGPLVVGANTRIFPYVTVGTEGEHRTRKPQGTIHIGADVIVREHTVVHRGTGDRETTIGDGCFILSHSYVAHDVVLEKGVTLSPGARLGGHTRVLEGANVGMGAMIHQFSTVGAYAMIGMGAVVTRDVPPFCLVTGNPARYRRFNTYAIDAAGLPRDGVRIDNGVLSASDPRMQACLDAFQANVRRKVLPLPQRP